MLIGRQNPKGGPPLKPNAFPLKQDPKTQEFGYLLGYTKEGEYILLPLWLAKWVADKFSQNNSAYSRMMNKIKPKVPFKVWLFLKLFGKTQYREMREEYQDEIGD